MKHRIFLPVLIALLTLTACGPTATSIEKEPEQKSRPAQETSGTGSAPPDDAPVSEQDKNNPYFKDKLKIPAEFANENGTAQDVWRWVNNLEKIYARGMYTQLSYSEDQKKELEKWLHGFMGEDLVNKRLKRALTPVEGGYRIFSSFRVYDFSPADNMIESVDKLDLQRPSKTQLILTADLTVLHELKVNVVYTLDKTEGKWKLTDYKFKKLP